MLNQPSSLMAILGSTKALHSGQLFVQPHMGHSGLSIYPTCNNPTSTPPFCSLWLFSIERFPFYTCFSLMSYNLVFTCKKKIIKTLQKRTLCMKTPPIRKKYKGIRKKIGRIQMVSKLLGERGVSSLIF